MPCLGLIRVFQGPVEMRNRRKKRDDGWPGVHSRPVRGREMLCHGLLLKISIWVPKETMVVGS